MIDSIPSSFLVILGVVVTILALWALSVLAVRWDTNRRNLTELERKTWFAVAVVLPLFGFALYLAMRVMRQYLTPPRAADTDDERITSVKPRVPAWRDVPQQEPANFGAVNPQPAWGSPAHGPSANGGQAKHTSATVPAPYQPLQSTFSIEVVQGPHMGQHFVLDQLPARIGRGPDAAIPLDGDLNVSRKHAELYEWNGLLRIRDMHSTHGTLINGTRVTDQSISPGDRIQVGGTIFILREVS